VTIGDDTKQVWTYDIANNKLTQLTFDGASAPVWAHEGSRIIFAARRDGAPDLFSKTLDGTGAVERLTRSPRTDVPHDWTPNAGVLFVEGDASGKDISLLSPDHAVRPLLATSSNETAPAASPDGRWLAYVSDQSGQAEVYVTTLLNPGSPVQVSVSGGTEPVWSASGSELYFRAGTRMMSATVRTRPTLAVQARQVLFHGAYESGSAARPAYDVSKDGTRFLMVRSAEVEQSDRELRAFVGWRLGVGN
jgi:Tol biopolymer transport system component